jgi:uncharacterized protein (DUF362 family)
MKDFQAPFVEESFIKIGLEYKEELLIKSNNTILIVGEIKVVQIAEEFIEVDGSIDLPKAKTVAISGLDSYLKAQTVKKLPYAKP